MVASPLYICFTQIYNSFFTYDLMFSLSLLAASTLSKLSLITSGEITYIRVLKRTIISEVKSHFPAMWTKVSMYTLSMKTLASRNLATNTAIDLMYSVSLSRKRAWMLSAISL